MSNEGLWRLVMFCDDKRLPEVMRSVAGKVMNMEPPTPVQNASAKGGSVKSLTNGDMVAVFIEYCAKNNIKSITRTELKDWLKARGKPGTYIAYFAQKMLGYGVAKKSKAGKGKGAPVRYDIVVQKFSAPRSASKGG